MDEPVGYGSTGDIGDQLPAPLHRDMLEDDQVNSQGPQPRPDGQRGIRDARRPGRDMRPAAGTPGLVQVVLDPLRRRQRDLLLLIRPGNPQVSGIRQVTAAGAGTLGMVILGPVRTFHVIDAPGLPGCFPRFFFFARSAARRCFRGGLRPGRSSDDGGIEEFPLFRDPARSAVSSRSRRSATIASSVAIFSACAAISCACSRISASRGSADGSPDGASVTACNHPGDHAHAPRQHHARRRNVTHDYSAQYQAQGPECLPSGILARGLPWLTGHMRPLFLLEHNHQGPRRCADSLLTVMNMSG